MSLMKRAPKDPARRRRLMFVVGAVLAALLVLVVVPGYLASQPGFFGGYPALAEQHGPWETSTHREAGCEGCHVPPGQLARAGYRVRMVGEFYLSLLPGTRRPDYFATPTNDACLACHSDLRTISPKGDLQIPHRAHITILKMECVACHNYLVHELSPVGRHAPTMAECLSCHDGDTAKDACTACHTQKAAPESHATEAWLVAHAAEAADPDCATCHKWTDDWCVDCHLDLPRSHGTDWRAVHGDRVAEHRNCEACHEAEYCVPCHGETPQLNYDPTLELVR